MGPLGVVSSSRGLATAIRVRQELTKRFLALRPAPRWGGPRSLLSLLKSDSRAHRCAEKPTDLADVLSALSSERYPSAHLATRAATTLPAYTELVADIARVRQGAWELSGFAPFSCQSGRGQFDCAPGHRRSNPDRPWNHFPSMGGILVT